MISMQTFFIGLLISAVWIYIWFDLAAYNTSNRNPLPNNKNLKVVGIYLLISIVIFYTTLYSASTLMYSTSVLTQVVCVGLLFFGAYLVIGARKEMSALTAREVLFSINPTYSSSGVFHKYTHPMFMGIGSILVASWCLLPSLLPALFLLTSVSLLWAKALVETNETKKQSDSQVVHIEQ